MNTKVNTLLGLAGALALAFSLGRGMAPSASLAQGEAPPAANLANLALAPSGPLATTGQQISGAFTYQGQLRKSGAPVNTPCTAAFRLFDAAAGGVQIGSAITQTITPTNGLFAVVLDFGWNFNGEARWLETAAGCGEAPTTLTPRTALRPAPYAFALPGMRTVPGNNDFNGNSTMNVIGGVAAGVVSNTISANSYSSVIGGGDSNRIDNSSFRSAIAGGNSNRIENDSTQGTIGGGAVNQIDASSAASTIGGGFFNRIDNGSIYSTIGGGASNRIENDSDTSTIGGGNNNRISGSTLSAIGGGQTNVIISATFGTIPGGQQASATQYGQQAYAAGGFGGEVGTAQASLYVLRRATSNAVTTTLYLDGTSEEIVLPVGQAMTFDIEIIGEGDGSAAYDMASYRFHGAVNRYGASSVTLFAEQTFQYEDAGAASWNAIVEKVSVEGKLRIRVVGQAGKNIRWVAVVRTAEVSWVPNLALMNAPVDVKR